MSTWSDWTKQLVEFVRAEATTRPAIRKLLLDYNTEADMDNTAGLQHPLAI